MGAGNHGERDEVTVIHIAAMCVAPYAVRAAIVLGVPDILNGAGQDAKLTAEEIASSIVGPDGTSVDSVDNLVRLLRLLASFRVVTEEVSRTRDGKTVERRYGATPALRCLSNNKDGVSLASYFLLYTDPLSSAPLLHLHAPVLDKKEVPFARAHGKGLFQYTPTDPRFSSLFNKAFHDFTHMFCKSMLQEYKGFKGLKSLVDVGGGVGANLVHILAEYPNLRGINFDLPHVVAQGVQVPRLEHVGGSFFESVPSADAIAMKWILHDWPDQECITILKNCHKSVPANGKIIVIELLVPEASDSSLATRTILGADVSMMTYTSGGKERILSEYRKLAAAAGFPRVEVAAMVRNSAVLEFYKT